ncbi:anthranilate phosphoribosyltransferase family protein [Oscillatoria sp. FACHB-1406]|uniref:anthranilate phosphoribosyltransferase family protein n=1 Tax=Oscillatoria sp. FACHB-1406 TaxID=2692846 RepID=UPI001687BE0B|nr:anthranilate phosphoribosyltransferase family protein [Oscillatoria sp. FACHB-1406]MBD2577644.1 anthranilate phosphoribosyltransferase family protein [Oscillatoria sp. FACHB-1406]
MSNQFRELLKKVGSGQHTKKDLTRSEAAIAAGMMLTQEATPAQIGAFLIAHRIKRPTGIELAGMLDSYDELSHKLQPLPPSLYPVVVFGIPYDGRSRTAPLTPITALLLAATGVNVILHGGDIMPTKYGIPLVAIWRGLGLEFAHRNASQLQTLLEQTGFTFVHISEQFPLAAALVPYRDQIGKRPPLATLELMWSPYAGSHHLIAGYVHPPTEAMMKVAFAERGQRDYTLVKGLEGSCDLRLSQTTIVVASQPDSEAGFKYLKLNPHDYGFAGKDVALESEQELFAQLETVLAGKPSELFRAIVWNSGFYLWRCGVCDDFAVGLQRAEELLVGGAVAAKRDEIRAAIR